MKAIMSIVLGLMMMHSASAHAVVSMPGSISGLAAYGSFRSLGKESIQGLTQQIEYVCIVKRKAELLSKVECTSFSDHLNYRLCSAVCSRGGNLFINFDGSVMPKVVE